MRPVTFYWGHCTRPDASYHIRPILTGQSRGSRGQISRDPQHPQCSSCMWNQQVCIQILEFFRVYWRFRILQYCAIAHEHGEREEYVQHCEIWDKPGKLQSVYMLHFLMKHIQFCLRLVYFLWPTFWPIRQYLSLSVSRAMLQCDMLSWWANNWIYKQNLSDVK